MGEEISGGFYLKARCIQNSEVAHAPPHVREIWDWFLKEAFFEDRMVSGTMIRRGQLLTSYEEIRDALRWYVGWRVHKYSKSDCETAMKWLKKQDMINTTKTTRGMIITICNYNKFQNPNNYENHSVAYTKTTRKPQTHDKSNTEKEISPLSSSAKKTNGPGFDENDVEYQLVEFFISCIEGNALQGRKLTPTPNIQLWCKPVRLLIERDGKTAEDIRRVMEWVTQDAFWKSNIMSTGKLREKFSMLFVKMNQNCNTHSDRVSEKTQRTIENLKDWSPPQ